MRHYPLDSFPARWPTLVLEEHRTRLLRQINWRLSALDDIDTELNARRDRDIFYADSKRKNLDRKHAS